MINEGKLNINAPLMSVRRSSGTPPSSTEAKRKILGNAKALPHNQVPESVAVPFNWEHIPGKPKGNSGSEPQPLGEPSITPTPSFPPAAKAMTLQPHQQHAPRKQSVLVAQTRDVTKLVSEEKKSFVNRHITDIIPYTGQFQEEEEEEEEEEESDDETDDHANISAKGCGLFPRSCIKNSLCLLNPVPETKIGNQLYLCSAYDVGKPDKNSHSRTYRSAPAIKKAWDAIHKSKSSSGGASPDMHESRKKWTSGSNRYSTYSGELKQLGKLSSFRRSGAAGAAAGISPFRSKPQPPFPGARLLGDSRHAENNQFGKSKFPSRGDAIIQEVLSQGAKRSSNSKSLSMEKTLYIDTASTVKSPCSNSSSVGNTQRIERNSVVGLEENLDSEVLSSKDANSITLSSMLSLMAKEDKAERLTIDQETNRELMSLQLVESSLGKDTKINNKQIVVVDDSGKADAKCVLLPLPPPLPKSPSESWLCRALPLVSLKNSFPYSSRGTPCHAKRQGFSRASSFSKWETIVKTSNLHHDHESCSRELTIYKSQHSKS